MSLSGDISTWVFQWVWDKISFPKEGLIGGHWEDLDKKKLQSVDYITYCVRSVKILLFLWFSIKFKISAIYIRASVYYLFVNIVFRIIFSTTISGRHFPKIVCILNTSGFYSQKNDFNQSKKEIQWRTVYCPTSVILVKIYLTKAFNV